MIERRPGADFSSQAPANTRLDPEDWRLEANCANYEGPILELPASLCIECPVKRQCGLLWKGMQDMLNEETTGHHPKSYLGGVWEGEAKPQARPQVGFGTVPIEPCGDDCKAPRKARGACRNHYQLQYARWKREK